MADPADRARRGGFSTRQWLLLLALATAAGVLAGQWLHLAPAQGQVAAGPSGPAPTAEAGGVVVIPAQLTRDNYGLYLVDPRRGTICVYQYALGDRRLRLMAARTYVFDTQLDSFSTEPTPEEIKNMVSAARRLTEVPPTTRP